MPPIPRYGSITSNEDEEEAVVELLPPHEHHNDNGEGTTTFIGTIDAGGKDGAAAAVAVANNDNEPFKKKWTSHRCISYTFAAAICLLSAIYFHNRAVSQDTAAAAAAAAGGDVSTNNKRAEGRVPMPPALSTLDPSNDLGFQTVSRKGLATPSKAWGERRSFGEKKDDDGGSSFTPLPTNEWYLNLLSHRAASNPSNAGEIAHVYTIPYILGVSPPNAPQFDGGASSSSSSSKVMAGIELFLPVMKTGSSNMQMVFDKNNGLSLGAIVVEGNKKGGDDDDDALTSYIVDPDIPLSPLGVSLKWNHVALKSSVVRGMPYGTMIFGKDAKTKKSVLPTILSGNRPVSILIDSDSAKAEGDGTSGESSSKKKMSCGTSDSKAQVYTANRELVLHMKQSDFTWVVFFSKPVKVECYSDAMPAISTPGAIKDVQFRLNVVEVMDNVNDNGDEDELVVRMALLDECTTGKSDMKEHCQHLKNLGYKTVSDENRSKEYLSVLREGAKVYPKSPLVGTEFPEDDKDENDRVTNVVFDWDATSVKSGDILLSEKVGAVSSTAVSASSLRATAKLVDASSTFNGAEKRDNHGTSGDLIMFALPHHLETFSTIDDESSTTSNEDSAPLCLHTFHGRTCLVRGSVWNLRVKHGAKQSFLADRPPMATAVPSLAEALEKDIKFKLSKNVLRGAADTYFPAKQLAKVGRVIEINEELKQLQYGEGADYSDADETSIEESASAAAGISLPSEEEVESLLDDLEEAVEIWLKPGGKAKGGAEAEFLYDTSWGGFVNCGCKYTFKKGHEAEGSCNNTFPECPAIEDVNEDFGNAWYNDHHFHYGYHIYAAAVVAKHRPEWAREYFERILLYIRDIANPSADDQYFPQFRQKDWYLGNSWAAGLMSMELSPHGREQESSSEAIAAFEGIALYGNAMMEVFANDEDNIGSARLVRNLGEFLTAMEVSATNRFWHVWGSKTDEEVAVTDVTSTSDRPPHINTYPKQYSKPVVGMMHETMASFQTWFGPEEVLSYGIQLIPLTAVAERRDDPEWSKILYPVYAKSCESANKANSGMCEKNGWSIAQAGLLGETGQISEALELASKIPEKVFTSLGGDGHSLTNTIWFISTRKQSD